MEKHDIPPEYPRFIDRPLPHFRDWARPARRPASHRRFFASVCADIGRLSPGIALPPRGDVNMTVVLTSDALPLHFPHDCRPAGKGLPQGYLRTGSA